MEKALLDKLVAELMEDGFSVSRWGHSGRLVLGGGGRWQRSGRVVEEEVGGDE